MSRPDILIAVGGIITIAALVYFTPLKPAGEFPVDVGNFTCVNNDYSCAAEFFRDITKSASSAKAIDTLIELKGAGRILPSVDDHQLAHEIGRQAAETFGVSSEAFLSCPMSAFNGGCQHGYFEYVLLRAKTATEAADAICKGLGDKYSDKFRFYCYHGVGHGVMMAVAYDLARGLEICDTLDPDWAGEGCWQGLFMENVNAGMRGEARDGIFSASDPLQPCESLPDKYQHQCYDNHAGYLMVYFKNDFSEAVAACLKAKLPRDKSTCLQSIGNMATNPIWQINFLGEAMGESAAERGWELCSMFPESYRGDCVIGGTNNIMNFHELQPAAAEEFCRLMDSRNAGLCYRTIGLNIRHQTVDEKIIRGLCAEFSIKYEKNCLDGAGL